MKAVIGATGKLGQALMKYPGTIECPIRFEEADKFEQWFQDNQAVDTVWHVARACRKMSPRRDFDTFMLEQMAMQKLLMTRARHCRVVYASTKVVYGITGNEVTPLSANNIAKTFIEEGKGVVNCPSWKEQNLVDISQLGNEHLIYAMTKLACEQYISSKCNDYKIIRIWDLLP